VKTLHTVIRLADLPKHCGLRRTQIASLVAAGKFPKPVKLSERRIAWIADEVAEWQAARVAARDDQR
jgi:prophage regulatory protein